MWGDRAGWPLHRRAGRGRIRNRALPDWRIETSARLRPDHRLGRQIDDGSPRSTTIPVPSANDGPRWVWSPICSITRPIIAARSMHADASGGSRPIPICRSCRMTAHARYRTTRTANPRRHRRAGDEAALEAVRVAALGKNGSITALLKTLGTLPPEERKSSGAADQRSQGPRQRGAHRAPRGVQEPRRSRRGSTPRASTSRCRCARRRSRSAASIRSPR